MDENDLSLEEFVRLPTTVDFQALASEAFLEYLRERPYLRAGARLANDYIVVYTNEKNIPQVYRELGGNFSVFYPKILSPVDFAANESAGITRVLEQPFLDLTGSGVIIGIADTGTDISLEDLRYEDGSTRLLGLWDQTLEGSREEGIYFGSTYSREDINKLLSSYDGASPLPGQDNDGHGTFMATVAAGSEKGDYLGAAPGASLVCVKLRRAGEYHIRRFLLSPEDPALYESSDMLLGIRYILRKALSLRMPAVIMIGMGSNFSAHDGNSLFEDYISFAAQRAGFAFVTAAGNESDARHHTQGRVKSGEAQSIDIRVGRQGVSFGTIIYVAAFDKISVGVRSPTGEVMTRKPFRPGDEYRERLILEESEITLRYSSDNSNIIWVGLEKATAGIWEINISGDRIIDGRYWAWLPLTGQVDPSVEFLKPVPEYTIVFPAAAQRSITCGAYNSFDDSLFSSSSWGPTRLPRISPDIVAPGVRIGGIYPEGTGTMTGTSAAAAVTAGAAALLMEWGIVKGNIPGMNGDIIRNLLIGGASRQDNMEYPDNKWGYGRLDLYGSFNYIRNT